MRARCGSSSWRRGFPQIGTEAHQSPTGRAPSCTSATGPKAWSPAAQRASGPAGREAPLNVRLDSWGGREPAEVAGDAIAKIVKTGWMAGQSRMTMSLARGTHRGGASAGRGGDAAGRGAPPVSAAGASSTWRLALGNAHARAGHQNLPPLGIPPAALRECPGAANAVAMPVVQPGPCLPAEKSGSVSPPPPRLEGRGAPRGRGSG